MTPDELRNVAGAIALSWSNAPVFTDERAAWWYEILRDTDVDVAIQAVKSFLRDGRPFAPDLSELIARIEGIERSERWRAELELEDERRKGLTA